jgi:DNA-directed RNA polymerase subunit E"
MEGKVCRKCKIIIAKGDKCPICGSTDLTTKWSSYIIVLNSEKSELAKKLNLSLNSIYALNIKE